MGSLNVLMFGWEFAPMFAGGLGIVAKGLTSALVEKGTKVTFVLPKKLDGANMNVKLISSEEFVSGLKLKKINSLLTPYMNAEEYRRVFGKTAGSGAKDLYGSNLFEEVYRYSEIAKHIAAEEPHDVIHAHDWMTFKAGVNAKKVSKKPLVVHVHTIEHDRTGGHGANPYVYHIEKEAFEEADKIIAVSNYTKNKIVEHYGVHPDKIAVVHNALDSDDPVVHVEKNPGEKVVLYLGRITLQKGPDYFVETAKKVLEVRPDTKFIVAGSGDMEAAMIERAAHYGIGDRVLFTGPVGREEANKLYQLSDVYVMPSVSEPFGITPLEAVKNGTPVILSKNSGVSEKLKNVFLVDFWDINETANKVVGLLDHGPLKEEMREHSRRELGKFSWQESAGRCLDVYKEVLRR